MAIQCGVCKNVMPSSSFPSHKKRKHAMEQKVSYITLPDINCETNCGQLIKCRFCPNRIPEHAMERHLQRSHCDCHLCGKTLLKSYYEKHMQGKHGNSPSPIPPPTNQTTVKPSNNHSDIIRVNEWQLHNYIRQNRVYSKGGLLYLRNVDLF